MICQNEVHFSINMSNSPKRTSNQTTQNSSADSSKIKVSICLDGPKPVSFKFKMNQDKKLKYLTDMFCNEIKKENDDTFFRDFNFVLSLANGTTHILDLDKTIKENKITNESKILAQEKAINPQNIQFIIKDLENRKIPIEMKKDSKFKKYFKQFCDSVGLDTSNTLFLYKNQIIDLDMAPKDVEGLKNNDIINIIQKNPIFNVFVENVPYDTNENELKDFFTDQLPASPNNNSQPIKCEIFMSDKKISGYAKLAFKSKSDALLAIANCSKNEFKNHKMCASLQ